MSSLLDYLANNRPLQLHSELPPGLLLPADLNGSEEISKLYHFDIGLLTPRPLSMDFDKILGKEVAIELRPSSTVTRYFHGLINQFSEGRKDEHFTQYRASLVPKFWLWTKQRRNRVFQRSTVPEILTTVLEGLDVQQNLTATYLPREYCVQYQESDFHFASRLMEEEGIFYYFDHRVDGHTLVLVDSYFKLEDVPGPATIRFDELEGGVLEELRINRWDKTQQICASEVTLWDYHFQMPDDHLEASQQLQEQVHVGTVAHSLKAWDQTLESYEYPGGYSRHFDGVDSSGGDEAADLSNIFKENQRIVQVRMQEAAAQAIWTEGRGNCAQFLPGHHFNLLWHGSGDGQYLLKRVAHSAKLDLGYRSDDTQHEMKYENTFTCLPAELPFRPRRVTSRPVIQGIQTATVVGPEKDQVFIDKYGRIKVQFHWDRHGKMDANSSCWVRVAQFWAGNRWGAFFWPRLGQEVVVTFEEGNPDRPLIIGSAYNADNMPPFELPKYLNLTGIRSCTLAGNGTQAYNTMLFDDTVEDEHLLLHSENHVHVSSETAHYNYVPHNHLEMIGSLPFGSGGGGGPRAAEQSIPESAPESPYETRRARLLLPTLDPGLVYRPEVQTRTNHSGLGGGTSRRQRNAKKARKAKIAEAAEAQPPGATAGLGLSEDFEILMRQVLPPDLLQEVSTLRQQPLKTPFKPQGFQAQGFGSNEQVFNEQAFSGQGGGLWDFAGAVANSGVSHKYSEFYENQMPASFKMTCGDSVGVYLRDNINRYWAATGKVISDLEAIVIGGALGALGASPAVETLCGALLGFDGSLNMIIGGNTTLSYGGGLTVSRGESIKVSQHAFWHTGVTGLTDAQAATAQTVSTAIRLLLVVQVIGCLISDILLRVKCVPDPENSGVEETEWVLFLYNAILARFMGVVVGLEKKFAHLQSAMDDAAAAAKNETQADEIVARANTAAADIADDKIALAETRLSEATTQLEAIVTSNTRMAEEASNYTRRIEGHYQLSAAGDMSFRSSTAAAPSTISIRAEGGEGTEATPGLTGSVMIVGTQGVNIGNGGAGGIRVTGSPVAVEQIDIDAGMAGTATMHSGVPDEGPRMMMNPIEATILNGVDEVGSAISIQVEELSISCGVPGVGAAIKLTPESLMLSVGENIFTLTPEGLTKEVLSAEDAFDIACEQMITMFSAEMDATSDIVSPLATTM